KHQYPQSHTFPRSLRRRQLNAGDSRYHADIRGVGQSRRLQVGSGRKECEMGDEQMTAEARQLWRRVEELWGLSVARDEAGVRAALHPDYTGWVTGQPLPHDRDAAIRSVGPDAPRVLDYRLSPLAVR